AAVGRDLRDFLRPPLRDFYLKAFDSVRETRHPWEHVYECSSPDTLRQLRMRVTVAPGCPPNSLLVVNLLVNEGPMRRRPFYASTDEGEYRRPDGLISMCANCRRTRRATEAVWDCVPRYVESMPPSTTHGLCPACLAIYFPEEIGRV